MAEFYDDYLGSYDQGYSSPVVSPDRASSARSPVSQHSRSMRRMNSSRSNPRLFVRGRTNYDEEGYGSEEYDDGPLELVMIRVKVCSCSNHLYFGELTFFYIASLPR